LALERKMVEREMVDVVIDYMLFKDYYDFTIAANLAAS